MRLSLPRMSRGRIESLRWISTQHTAVRTSRSCRRRWRMCDLLEAKVRSTHRPPRYILLRYRYGKARGCVHAGELTSDRRGQRGVRSNKEIGSSRYIRYGDAQSERRYWWWGVISTSARIVYQGRNMVAHINEKDTACQRYEDWNLINSARTWRVALATTSWGNICDLRLFILAGSFHNIFVLFLLYAWDL